MGGPIQVISGVDMVANKNGFVLVNVSNRGNITATASVLAWLNDTALSFAGDQFSFIKNINPRPVAPSSNELFIFSFTPLAAGNLTLNASVSVS